MSISSFHCAVSAITVFVSAAVLGGTLYSCSPAHVAAAPKENSPVASPLPPKHAASELPKPVQTVSFQRPKYVKGIYLTAWTAGGSRLLDRYL